MKGNRERIVSEENVAWIQEEFFFIDEWELYALSNIKLPFSQVINCMCKLQGLPMWQVC